jgi:SPP1 family predicted phage head-tail adaptor
MRAGQLRYRIAIEKPVEVQDEYGEVVRTWEVHTLAFAKKEDLAGREYFAGQQLQSEVTTRFRTRHIEGTTSTMRIVCEGVIYDIDSVQDPDGRKRELILMGKRNG